MWNVTGPVPLILYADPYGYGLPDRLAISQKNPRRPDFSLIHWWEWGEQYLRDSSDVAAVIVPVSRELLADASYRGFLQGCRRIAERNAAFRLYLLPHAMTLDELFQEARQDPGLAEVVDTVNISTQTGDALFAEIDASLNGFLDALDDIRDAPKHRRLMRAVLAPFALGSMAGTAGGLVAAGLILLIVTGVLPAALLREHGEALALGCGYFGGTALLTAVATRRFRLLPAAWIGLMAFAAFRAPLDWRWLAAGLLLALALDHLRRRWIMLLPLAITAADGTVAVRLGRRLAGLFGGTLWPRQRQVFISYARRTWADPTVRRLRTCFQDLDVACFLDISDIELGSSWRFALEEGIRQSTLFLFFDDGETGKPLRHWHQAELVTASNCRSRTGFPSIAVVTQQAEGVQPLQLYKSRLARYLAGADYRIVPLAADAVDRFARNVTDAPIRPHGPVGPSNIWWDSFVGVAVQAPLMLLMAGLATAANLVRMLGLPAVAAAVVGMYLGHDLRHWLNHPICLGLLWLAVGFNARRVLHLRFEARAPHRSKGLAGLLVSLILLALAATWLTMGGVPLAVTFYATAGLLGFASLDFNAGIADPDGIETG
ncbi:MAG TPA: toll/interleukin-1 receptor domain-containing protein [Acidobacteriota bacterium]|nr:toll/interleukin-1 receptor domain-containing protein [Acidobacteriota bacterium]HQG92980.1 toll/interleukin-1 receptor domain-containing protein [Acidobacteriota bacterium]HQK89047.1 toll/interleukin-1 receptor domain-containing protein [Acidobacteriota bacterium]